MDQSWKVSREHCDILYLLCKMQPSHEHLLPIAIRGNHLPVPVSEGWEFTNNTHRARNVVY